MALERAEKIGKDTVALKMDELRKVRAASKVALERAEMFWKDTVTNKDDIEWEDLRKGYARVCEKYDRASRAHMEVLEKATVEGVVLAEGEDKEWMTMMDSEFRAISRRFGELTKTQVDKENRERMEENR